jgi:hypothetical protein
MTSGNKQSEQRIESMPDSLQSPLSCANLRNHVIFFEAGLAKNTFFHDNSGGYNRFRRHDRRKKSPVACGAGQPACTAGGYRALAVISRQWGFPSSF